MELEFDFKKCGRSIDEVGHREQNAALKVLMGYLTKELKGKTQAGCYSEEAIGCPAVEYFASIAMAKVFNGNWTWKEETKLTTLLCNCAGSEMAHWSRDWKKKKGKGELEPPPVSYLANPEALLDKLAADDENQMKEEERWAADEKEEQKIKMTFDEAKEIVKDDLVMVKLLKVIQTSYDNRQIEKRMNMSVAQREEAMEKLIECLKQGFDAKWTPLRKKMYNS